MWCSPPIRFKLELEGDHKIYNNLCDPTTLCNILGGKLVVNLCCTIFFLSLIHCQFPTWYYNKVVVEKKICIACNNCSILSFKFWTFVWWHCSIVIVMITILTSTFNIQSFESLMAILWISYFEYGNGISLHENN